MSALETELMATCKWCFQPFPPVKDWQLFCSDRHCQDWHLHQRKMARQEKLLAKLKRQEEALAKLSNGQLAELVLNSRGSAEERQRANEVFARLIEEHRSERPKMLRRM